MPDWGWSVTIASGSVCHAQNPHLSLIDINLSIRGLPMVKRMGVVRLALNIGVVYII